MNDKQIFTKIFLSFRKDRNVECVNTARGFLFKLALDRNIMPPVIQQPLGLSLKNAREAMGQSIEEVLAFHRNIIRIL